MIFRFRVCQYSDAADTAQEWVVASSEIHARALIGGYSFLQPVPFRDDDGIPLGTLVLTEGSLTT